MSPWTKELWGVAAAIGVITAVALFPQYGYGAVAFVILGGFVVMVLNYFVEFFVGVYRGWREDD
jgi:hypothetical protein